MGGGNAQKSETARLRNLKDAGKEGASGGGAAGAAARSGAGFQGRPQGQAAAELREIDGLQTSATSTPDEHTDS